jgi:hypothetical protein
MPQTRLGATIEGDTSQDLSSRRICHVDGFVISTRAQRSGEICIAHPQALHSQLQKILDQPLPILRKYAFRMELHALDLVLAMPQTHDDAITRAR